MSPLTVISAFVSPLWVVKADYRPVFQGDVLLACRLLTLIAVMTKLQQWEVTQKCVREYGPCVCVCVCAAFPESKQATCLPAVCICLFLCPRPSLHHVNGANEITPNACLRQANSSMLTEPC